MRVRVAIIFQFPRRPTASLKIHRNFGFGSRWLVSANCIELLAFVPLKSNCSIVPAQEWAFRAFGEEFAGYFSKGDSLTRVACRLGLTCMLSKGMTFQISSIRTGMRQSTLLSRRPLEKVA